MLIGTKNNEQDIKYNIDLFYDINDFLKELKEYDLKYKLISNEIVFPSDEISLPGDNGELLSEVRRTFIINRHLKTDNNTLAIMLYKTLIHKDGNFIPYIKRMVENYTLQDYLIKIDELFENKNDVNYYYIIGSILELMYKNNPDLYSKIVYQENKYFDYVNYFIKSLLFEDSYCVFKKNQIINIELH